MHSSIGGFASAVISWEVHVIGLQILLLFWRTGNKNVFEGCKCKLILLLLRMYTETLRVVNI